MSEFLHLGDCKKTIDHESSVAVHALSGSNISVQTVLNTKHGANQGVIRIVSEGLQDA